MSKKTNPELINEKNLEWTAKMLKQSRPASEVLLKVVEAHRRGCPLKKTVDGSSII